MALKGLGREETCVVHHDRPAVARCAHCHKPVCSECVVSTKDGKFCSHECARKMADFRANLRKVKKGGGLVGKLVKLVIIVVVILIAIYAANKLLFKSKKVDRAFQGARERVEEGIRGAGGGAGEAAGKGADAEPGSGD